MSPSPATTPREIGPDETGARLRIEWADDHVSIFEPRALRLSCPCAACVDEMTGERMLTPGMIPEGIHPTAIHYVGRYAIQFVWSDGHETGIYPFDYLRRLDDPAPPSAS